MAPKISLGLIKLTQLLSSTCSQVLQFPPALHHYITGELQKQVILVLNKVDLCPAPLVLAWRDYLSNHFPHLQCVCFTSHPGQPYSSCESTSHMHHLIKMKTKLVYEKVFQLCCVHTSYFSAFVSFHLATVLQKKRMRRKGGWGQAGGPIHILRACQEITAGKGRTRPPYDCC